jgi:hypothetical protein
MAGREPFSRQTLLPDKELIHMNIDCHNQMHPERGSLIGKKAVVIPGQPEWWTNLAIGSTAAVVVFFILRWLAS